MAPYERLVIRRAALGLFHGADCFEAYAKYCCNSHLVHDIHVGSADLIELSTIRQQRTSHDLLRIAYAGRVHREKGVFDWIDAMAVLASQGTAFDAVWFGDGPDIEARCTLA
jgi:glycosyltransferase involved in cell wall biosynthesis